jgi:hypothetical protein
MFKYSAAFAAAVLLFSTAAHADSHATAARLVAMPGGTAMELVDLSTLPAKFDKDTLVILCDVSCQKALHASVTGDANPKTVEMSLKLMMDHNAYVARILGRTVN